MGLISSIASIFGAASKKKAVDRAASEQLAYSQQGMDALNTGAGQATGTLNDFLTRALSANGAGQQRGIDALMAQLTGSGETFAPWIDNGQKAALGLGDLTGLGGATAQDNAIQQISGSPLYQRLLGAGQNSVLAGASATGGVRGGNVQTSLADFASQLLGGQVQQQISNLGGISTQGLNAAGTAGAQQGSIAQLIAQLSAQGGANDANLITGAGGNIANVQSGLGANLANLFNSQGAIRAGGILGKEQANQGIISGVGQAIGDIAGAFIPGGSTVARFI